MSTEKRPTLNHKDVIINLQELGLSFHEAQIYTTLLEIGEVSAGQVLDRLPLHREQVYRALKRLVDAELVTTYIKRKRSYYQAVNPDSIIRKQEAKTAIAKSLQPYLQQLQQQRPQVIQVNEGPDVLERLLEDIARTVPDNSEYLVLGGVGELFYQQMKEVLPAISKKLSKKGITVRIIAFQGQDYSGEQALLGSAVRYLAVPMGGPTATVIYGNKVAIEIFDPNNLAVITIENDSLAQSYKQTFEAIWEMAATK